MALRCAWVEFFVLCILSCSAGKGYFKKESHDFSTHEYCQPLPIQTFIHSSCQMLGHRLFYHRKNILSQLKKDFFKNDIGKSKPRVTILRDESARPLYHLAFTIALKGRLSGWQLISPLYKLAKWGAERWSHTARMCVMQQKAWVMNCRDLVQRGFPFTTFIHLSDPQLKWASFMCMFCWSCRDGSDSPLPALSDERNTRGQIATIMCQRH